ncbi:hypothetical protein MVEN_00980600 [Mycena venus]|uniref:F-box domain-containing protein n=1 Tax=Mycena venus TaxID=2733690 RepID=A0A8H6Y8U7_9AGAR|nr:hypothetical protein MVEN_00980600 [Mycena venus]
MDVFNIEEDVFFFESAEERQARELRTLQNELAPIASLPPEILADIFVRCVPTSIATDLSWLNVTRVCSHWRNVLLACPDFWSTLIFSRPKWTPVMLARSKMASLVVRVDLKKDHANSPEPILLENAWRLGILDLRSPQHELTTFLGNLEQANAAPRLQCIKIVNTNIDNLENISPAQRPTMDAFLAILVGSPNLQTLTVLHCSPTTSRGFTVELSHLTALTIHCSSSTTCSRLLSYLIIPSSAVLETSCTIPVNYDTRNICQSLIPIFSEDLSPDTYDTVRIEYGTVRVDHKGGFSYSLHNSARPEWSRKLRIGAMTWGHDNALRLTEAVRDSLDFSHISTLHLNGMPLMPFSWAPGHNDSFTSALSLWDTMGRNLHRVTTLHLHKFFPSAMLEFLLTQAMLLVGVSHYKSCFNTFPSQSGGLPFRGPDGVLTHAFPSLRCLGLHEINLEDSLGPCKPWSGDVLRALLWARREGRAPIWQLEIDECTNVSTHELAHFRLFADVIYDGKGQKTGRKADGADESLRSYSIDIFVQMVSGTFWADDFEDSPRPSPWV